MPAATRSPFEYAALRVVPSMERGEFLNAGVVVLCRPRRFLAARVGLDRARLAALAPAADAGAIERHLAELQRIAAGEPDAGPVAALEASERFGRLVAPASTVVQPSPVHTGLCDDPAATLDRLFATLVPTERPAVRLAAMRDAYTGAGLHEGDLAGDWLAQFERWLADAVTAGVPEPNAFVLATAARNGRPSGRTVLLKGVDERGFVLYTNLGSPKAREALENPHASLVFPWVALGRQVVVTGTVAPVPAEESDAYFATRPHGSRLGALASPQSRVIAGRTELERRRAELARRYPEGAPVPRPEWWGGLRVAPDAVEFWQGRPDRLHDRLRFRRDERRAWVVERLAP